MNLGRSSLYVRLAVRAGRQSGLKNPTPQRVAADGDARARRDVLWAELDKRLADERTYTLDDLVAWLATEDVHVSIAPVFRCRRRILDERRRVQLANARTAEMLSLMKDVDEGDVLTAARKAAGQILFDLFVHLDPDALADLKPAQIVMAFEVAGRLTKAHADAGLAQERLAALRRAFDEKVAAAAGKTGDGRLTPTDIAEIREAVFGNAA